MSVCTILLENMEFKAYHGCYAMERVVGNRFLVTLSVQADVGQAASSDDIASTLNYLELYRTVQEQMAIPSHLLENVARRIIDAVAYGFDGVQRVDISVSKLAPPLGGKVEKVSVSLSGEAPFER